jgi:hypothetical protein
MTKSWSNLILCSSASVLAAYGSSVEIHDESKLSQKTLQVVNNLPAFERREVKIEAYNNLGDFHGYSCKNQIWDKPVSESDAMKQLKIKISGAGGYFIETYYAC